MDIFEYHAREAADGSRPLPHRMRPRNLAEFVGQDHVVGPGSLIRKAIENGGHDNMSTVFAAIESTGGIPYTAQAAQQEADQAIAAIEPLPASPYKEALYSLAEFSVNRAY